MLYADDAGIVSKSAEGLAKMTTVVATVFEASGLTVTEKTTEPHASRNNVKNTQEHQTRQPSPHRLSSKQQVRGMNRRLGYFTQVALSTKALASRSKSTRLMRACLKRFDPELYDRTTAALSLKV